MPESKRVYGTLQKVEGHLQLIPDGERHPELAGVTIYSRNKVGTDKKYRVQPGQTDTFLVELESDGAYHVKGIAAADTGSPPRSAPPPRAPSTQPGAPDAPPPDVESAPPTTFIHPYNFVRLPSQDALEQALAVAPFQRGPSAPHDRYDRSLQTGYIDCELTTHTDWFIPDPRKVHKPDPAGHATLGYFTLDHVKPGEWGPDRTQPTDRTQPAIPGSSLRGMVRSVFETATLSCFGIFGGGALEFRATRLLAGHGYRYVPARVLSLEGPKASLQLLPSRLPGDQVAGAHHRCYQVTRVGDKITNVRFSGTLASHPDLRSGTRVVAIVKSNASTHRVPDYMFREATHVFPIPEEFPHDFDSAGPPLVSFLDDAIAEQAHSSGLFVFGYFCRTGWNIERKHDEKVFYSDGPYNGVGAGTTRAELLARLRDFVSDQAASITADADVVGRTNASLADYAQRHHDELTSVPRDPAASAEIQLSDFVVAHAQLAPGQLVHTVLTPNGKVIGIYPVSLPRVWHQDTVADLLPAELQPCSRTTALDAHKLLCPACRVFGWTRDLQGQDVTGQADRVDAVAGHVRFAHGVLVGPWDASGTAARPTPLPVLGTPHPTCTEFYLRENGDYASARSSRIPPTLANDKSFPFPMYRSEEARLRGRKFSRRRDTTSYDSDDPAAGGLRRPKDENGTSGIQDSQNQTVYLLPKNLKFSFRVYFDNLTDAELGALLFALDLAVPDSWRESGGSISSPLFHALGHGTRLGMGRCSICIQKLQLDVMDPAKPDCRYRQSPDFASAEVAASPDVPETVRSVFSSSWRSVFSLPGLGGKEFKPVVADLMNLLQVCDGPLHYPNYWHPQMGSEVQYYDSFTWFMANRRGDPKSKRRAGHNKLPLPDEETSGTRRLPIDPAPG